MWPSEGRVVQVLLQGALNAASRIRAREACRSCCSGKFCAGSTPLSNRNSVRFGDRSTGKCACDQFECKNVYIMSNPNLPSEKQLRDGKRHVPQGGPHSSETQTWSLLKSIRKWSVLVINVWPLTRVWRTKTLSFSANTCRVRSRVEMRYYTPGRFFSPVRFVLGFILTKWT